MTDPKDIRYDKKPPASGHQQAPPGLKPSVNVPVAPKAPVAPSSKAEEKAPTLTPELKKRRLELFNEIREQIADFVPPSPPDTSIPTVAPVEPSKEINYRSSLMEALGSPEFKSMQFGVIGTGHCGNRLADQFGQFGYNAVAINTAQQDLAHIQLAEDRKLLLPYALGGAGKDIAVGQAAAIQNLPAIVELLKKHFTNVDQILICTSAGGGSGAGSLVPLLEAISQVEAIAGLPIVLIYALPLNEEGAVAKSNAVKTLDRIARMANDNVISSLVIVDNAKIQARHPNVSVKDFWKLANFDIVNLFNVFNTVSKLATQYDALDPMDFANILATGGCLIYGRSDIQLELDEQGQVELDAQKLAEALLSSATEGVLAEGFDVHEAVRIGVIITGSEKVLSQIPAINVNYAFNALSEQVGQDVTIYRGVYADESAQDTISVHTIFSGLGLPHERVQRLLAEANSAVQRIENKQKTKLTLLDNTATQQNQQKDLYADIKSRNSPMGKMIAKNRRPPIR